MAINWSNKVVTSLLVENSSGFQGSTITNSKAAPYEFTFRWSRQYCIDEFPLKAADFFQRWIILLENKWNRKKAVHFSGKAKTIAIDQTHKSPRGLKVVRPGKNLPISVFWVQWFSREANLFGKGPKHKSPCVLRSHIERHNFLLWCFLVWRVLLTNLWGFSRGCPRLMLTPETFFLLAKVVAFTEGCTTRFWKASRLKLSIQRLWAKLIMFKCSFTQNNIETFEDGWPFYEIWKLTFI